MDKPIPEDAAVVAGEVSTPEVWEPTTRLRWSKDRTLQQAWLLLTTGSAKWVDVPVEGEE